MKNRMPVSGVFHYAFHVDDLDEARAFYGEVLGCRQGREAETWIDFDFFGHQLSLHKGKPSEVVNTGRVGAHLVPMPHFGVALLEPEWEALAARLEGRVEWIIPPETRFAGLPGQQKIMFFRDPAGNAIEIKGFRDWDALYAP